MSDLDTLLGSIAVLPFPKVRYFNHSGAVVDPGQKGHYVTYSTAIMVCPKCLNLGNVYDVGKYTPFLTSYCKGNLPPEIEHKNVLGQTCTHQVSCAGVTVEHFHVKCGVCDYTSFLGIPEKENG